MKAGCKMYNKLQTKHTYRNFIVAIWFNNQTKYWWYDVMTPEGDTLKYLGGRNYKNKDVCLRDAKKDIDDTIKLYEESEV